MQFLVLNPFGNDHFELFRLCGLFGSGRFARFCGLFEPDGFKPLEEFAVFQGRLVLSKITTSLKSDLRTIPAIIEACS